MVRTMRRTSEAVSPDCTGGAATGGKGEVDHAAATGGASGVTAAGAGDGA